MSESSDRESLADAERCDHVWRHEPRLSVGGRTLYICTLCGAEAVDDNEEPSGKDIPVKSRGE